MIFSVIGRFFFVLSDVYLTEIVRIKNSKYYYFYKLLVKINKNLVSYKIY